jgi:hypothetical protein
MMPLVKRSTGTRIRDAVVEVIRRELSGERGLCIRSTTRPRVDEAFGGKGLEIEVWLVDFAQPETASRSKDRKTFTIGIQIAEYYRESGELSQAWVDDRIALAESLWNYLGEARTASNGQRLFEGDLRNVWPSESTGMVCDLGELDRSLFWSMLVITYSRHE